MNVATLGFISLAMFFLPQDESVPKTIGTVLGKPVVASDLNENVDLREDLQRLFLAPVEAHYCRAQEIDPEEELKRRVPNEGVRAAALQLLRQRVLQKHLYEKHGGRVLLSAFGPFAYDAYRTWMKERETAGDFEVTDPHYRELLFRPLDERQLRQLTEDAEIIRAAFDPKATEQFIVRLADIPPGAIRNPRRRLVGEILGTPIYLDDRSEGRVEELLYAMIIPRLEASYREHHPEIAPTESDIKWLELKARESFLRNYASTHEVYERAVAEYRERDPDSQAYRVALRKLKDLERRFQQAEPQDFSERAAARKLQKHLHDTYGGGRALMTPLDAIAFDAQLKWVEERERLGDFQIVDRKIRGAFYEYWDNSVQRERPRQMVDPDSAKALFRDYVAADGGLPPANDRERRDE